MFRHTPLQLGCTIGAVAGISLGSLALSVPAAAVAAAPAAASRAGATAPAPTLSIDTTEYRVSDRLVVTGTAGPGAFVDVRITGTYDHVTTTAGADGRWATTSNLPVDIAGGITIEVSARSGVATSTETRALVEDTSERPLTIDTDSYRQGDLLTITGAAEPGAVVVVLFGGPADNARGEADSNGRWSATSNYPVDAVGQIVIEAHTGVQNARVVTKTLDEDESERPLTVSTTSYRAGDRLTVTGTAEPGTFVGGRVTGTHNGSTARVDADGVWSITTPFPVDTRGQVSVEVTTGSGGNARTITQTLVEDTSERLLTVDTTEYQSGHRAVVTGTAEPGALIAVHVVGTTDLVVTNADRRGAWSTTSSRPIAATGQVTIEVTTGNGPTTRTIQHSLTDAVVVPFRVTSPVSGSTVVDAANFVTWTGTAPAGTLIRIATSGGRTITIGKADTNGKWAARGTLAHDLMYTVNVTATMDGEDSVTEHQIKVVTP